MGSSGKNAGPPGQDPTEMLEAMTRLNRVDQYTPTGSVQFSGPDRNIATVSNTPEQQALLEGQQNLTGTALDQMLGQFGTGTTPAGEGMYGGATDEMAQLASTIGGLGNIDLSALTSIPGQDDLSANRQKVEEATMGRLMNLVNPQFDRRGEREGQSLSNRGIPEISELADVISGRRADDYQQATMGAALESILAGGQEQSRLLSEGRAGRAQGLQEQLASIGNMSKNRDQLFREIMGTYGADRGQGTEDFNKLAALLGMSQINSPGAGMAGFWQPGQADVTGANQVAQQGWQIGQQYSTGNQLLEGLTSIIGMGLGAMSPA